MPFTMNSEGVLDMEAAGCKNSDEAILYLLNSISTSMFCIENMIDERPSNDYAGRALDIFLHNWLEKSSRGLSEHVCEYKALTEER